METKGENPCPKSDEKLGPEPIPDLLEEASLPQTGTGTYREILKSSALIGGSSALNIGVGVVRTKVFALLLGPAGFGLFGIYGSISNLVQCIAGFGINSSGVREIAYAVGTGDERKISTIISVMRRTSVLLGVLGGSALAILARPISVFTFGNAGHSGAVAFLGFAVLFQLVANGEGAVIQGARRVGDLARLSVWGAVLGTAASIPIVYFFREAGVVPSLACVAVMTFGVSWWYGHKVSSGQTRLTLAETGHEASALLKLGLVFMTSYLMTMGTAYAVRMIVLRNLGYAAVGYYQSAWTLGGLYVGFILQSMGTDFYPRLTASSDDNDACNRLINEQTQVGLLLAGPGVLGTITLAPVVITLFYSSHFGAAVGVLRWIALGTLVQVISWPLSYMLVAKNQRLLYFLTEAVWGVVSVAFAYLFVRYFGLNGTGIAFLCSNLVAGLLVWPIAWRLSRFRWSSANLKTGGLFLLCVAAVFVASRTLPFAAVICAGMIALLVSSLYSIRTVIALVSVERIPRPVRLVLERLGMVSPQTSVN